MAAALARLVDGDLRRCCATAALGFERTGLLMFRRSEAFAVLRGRDAACPTDLLGDFSVFG
jgi:hypothetical protein